MSVVEKAIENFPFKGRNLLVSCSGGVDSMVLLRAICKAGMKPEVVHINYHLRAEDSDLDQQLVEKVSKELGLKCSVFHCPKEFTKGKGKNLQAAARDFRRKIYADWIADSPDNCVVLAHHADDQVETFFLQHFRGSGSLGLGGMYPDKNGILRPFLEISREDILNYVVANKVQWREDKSNESLMYVRNLFRNKLIPALLEENGNLKESILEMMRVFRDQRDLNEEIIQPVLETWRSSQSISVQVWQTLESDQQILVLHKLVLPLWVKDRIEELINGAGSQKLELENGILVLDGTDIRFIDRSQNSTWDFKIEEVEFLPEEFSKNEIYLDGTKFHKDEVVFRFPNPGDRIKSLGMTGSQLLSDIFRDAGISSWKRSEIQIVEIAGEIIWIPGIKVGRSLLATGKCPRIIRLSVLDTAK